MLRVSLRNLLAHKVRLLLSAVAIVLGVAFVAGTLVFTDTLDSAFDGIVEGGVPDVTVQPAGTDQTGQFGAGGAPVVPASLLPELEDLDGVARVDGSVNGSGVYLVASDGTLVGGQGAPTLAFNWNDGPSVTGDPTVTIAEGREPRAEGEVVLDERSAENAGYAVGDEVSLVSAGDVPEMTAELVGTATFAGGGLAGATLVLFDTATAQALFLGGQDAYSAVALTTTDSATQQQVADAATSVLPEGFEAVTGDTLAADTEELIGQALGFLSTFLLVFAGIALVVGTFLIINTFSMLVAQRSRELALLRAMGASRQQVTRAVLLEAVVVGIIGSTAGLALGFGLSVGLRAVFARFGLDLSGTGLVFAPRTVLVSYLVGVGVTLVAAYLPARRASRIPPVAAMRDDVALPESSVRVRLAVGAGLVVLGAGGIVVGFVGEGGLAASLVGVGVLAILIGVSLTTPVLGRPLLHLMGAVYRRLFGSVGQMAAQNALRNPRRTAATASALMIGLALVSTMSVLGSSINRSIEVGVQEEFTTDFLVSSALFTPFSTTVADRVRDLDGVEDVVAVQSVPATLDGEQAFLNAADPAQVAREYELDVTSGTLDVGDGQIALTDSEAADLGAGVGDVVVLGLPGGDADLEVVGTYEDSNVVSTALVPFSVLADAGVPRQDSALGVVASRGAVLDAVGAGLDEAVASQPMLSVQNQQDFTDAQRAQVNQVLFLIYALLGLAVVIAVLGVVNTLALSVIERTREVGLLRAVGLSRRQLRRMVRLEAVAIAVLGAVLGVVLGVLFGVVLQRSVADQGITDLAVPAGRLAGFVVVSGLLGVLAAGLPARRAARLDVLRAITTE